MRRTSKTGGRRSGAGRPPLDPAIKRGELISVRVTPAFRAQVAAAADAAELSVSDWMLAAAELAISRGRCAGLDAQLRWTARRGRGRRNGAADKRRRIGLVAAANDINVDVLQWGRRPRPGTTVARIAPATPRGDAADMATFDSAVRSQALNRPIILYTITTSGRVFRHTTNRVDVVFAGQTFTALTIAHDDEQMSGDASGDELIIHLPITHPVVQRFVASGIPEQSVQVTVQELQSAAATAALSWSGPAQSISIDGHMASIRVPTTTNDAMKIQLPVIAGQKPCNHRLFDSGCAPIPGDINGGPVAIQFQHTSEITDVSADGLTLTFVFLDSMPDNFFDFGRITAIIFDSSFNGETQMRSIITHVGLVVTIDVPFVATADQMHAAVFTLEAGCDHTIQGLQGCVAKFANAINYGGHPQMNSAQNIWQPSGLGVIQQV